jgi:N-acyl-D-amino-acid deacylase
MLERFKDPAQRARIAAEIEQAMKARFGGPEGVFLPATKRQLVDVMREQQAAAGETVLRILEQGNTAAILRFGSEADLVKILQHPTTSISCDCGASTDTRQHPRAWGTFPRVLGRYVRETKALTWEDAIRKMTALPAATIGMVDRGYLAPGMAADITVFDPATVIDHATYEDAGQLSEGIREVLVNGGIALRGGKVTGERRGRVLSRTPHMPSRPMASGPRNLSIAGRIPPATDGSRGEMKLSIDVRQQPSDSRAKGRLRVTDGTATFEATEWGVLQTAEKWASFTARVSTPSSREERSAVVIVEFADPFVAGQPRTVTIVVDGQRLATGVLQ